LSSAAMHGLGRLRLSTASCCRRTKFSSNRLDRDRKTGRMLAKRSCKIRNMHGCYRRQVVKRNGLCCWNHRRADFWRGTREHRRGYRAKREPARRNGMRRGEGMEKTSAPVVTISGSQFYCGSGQRILPCDEEKSGAGYSDDAPCPSPVLCNKVLFPLWRLTRSCA
jgi:hypothetical protein